MQGLGLSIAALALLLSAFVTARSDSVARKVGRPAEPGQPHSSAVAVQRPAVADHDTVPLELCECEPAQGSPSGLSCEKEGWFMSSFEETGRWGAGEVPLSRGVCCRPCLPKTVPGSPKNTTALAVFSYGCHASSNPGSASEQCESNGGSFVTGAAPQQKCFGGTAVHASLDWRVSEEPSCKSPLLFRITVDCMERQSSIGHPSQARERLAGWSQAISVPSAEQLFYPVGAVDCCTPALMLSTGDTRELERCECEERNSINCGGASESRILAGYTRWGVSQFGEFVPLAPALCCKSCISDRVIPANACFDLNYCSGHGVCNLGACECATGYGGSDCRDRVAVAGDGLPRWQISIIIVASCVTFSVFIIVLGKIVRHYTGQQGGGEEQASEEGDELREPLILGLASDDEGSVGSLDSSDADEDDAHLPPPISRRPQPAQEEAVGGGVPVQPGEGEPAAAPRAEPFEISHDAAERADGEDGPHGGSEEEAENTARIEADEVVIEAIRSAEVAHQHRTESASGSCDALKEGLEDEPVKEQIKDRGGVPGIDCSVCFGRPVQVAVVPCGHMCMCRRCSRRLAMCPVCRCRIIRRQRIFVGG